MKILSLITNRYVVKNLYNSAEQKKKKREMLNIAFAACMFPYTVTMNRTKAFKPKKGPKGTYNRHNRSYRIASEDMKYGA